MASFNSRTKIEMEIDGVKVSLDGLSTNLFKSLEKITKKSNDLAKRVMESQDPSEEKLLADHEEMGQICIEFLSEVLPEEAYQKLVIEKMEDLFYLIDVTAFILNEIKKAKEERISKLIGQSKRVYS